MLHESQPALPQLYLESLHVTAGSDAISINFCIYLPWGVSLWKVRTAHSKAYQLRQSKLLKKVRTVEHWMCLGSHSALSAPSVLVDKALQGGCRSVLSTCNSWSGIGSWFAREDIVVKMAKLEYKVCDRCSDAAFASFYTDTVIENLIASKN